MLWDDSVWITFHYILSQELLHFSFHQFLAFGTNRDCFQVESIAPALCQKSHESLIQMRGAPKHFLHHSMLTLGGASIFGSFSRISDGRLLYASLYSLSKASISIFSLPRDTNDKNRISLYKLLCLFTSGFICCESRLMGLRTSLRWILCLMVSTKVLVACCSSDRRDNFFSELRFLHETYRGSPGSWWRLILSHNSWI